MEASWAISGFLVLAVCLAGGCASHVKPTPPAVVEPPRSGNVDSNLIVPDQSARMQLSSNQIFIMGDAANPHAMPVYPPALLPLRLPDQAICLHFATTDHGAVEDVVPVYGVSGCPDSAASAQPEFLAAAIAAVSQWEYFASIRCTFPPGAADVDKCNGAGASFEVVAVTLAYRFVFTSKDGAGTVQGSEVGH